MAGHVRKMATLLGTLDCVRRQVPVPGGGLTAVAACRNAAATAATPR